MSGSRLYGSGEAAALIGVGRARLIQLIEHGKLPEPTHRLPGRRLFTEQDLQHLKDALQALEAYVFAPVRTALAASRVSRVSLHVGRRALDLTPSVCWAFWRRARPLAELAQ